MFSDEMPHPDPPQNGEGSLPDEENERLDDATIVFDWLQTLDPETFEQVISVISVMRQNTAYAANILAFLNGNNKVQTR
jgi:hypothetical protein